MAKKRPPRGPTSKPGQLKVKWGKLPGDAPDVCVSWGEGCSGRDGNLLLSYLCTQRPRYGSTEMYPSLVDELKSRGYDITTLRFSIEKKKPLAQPGQS